jgi:hypothetical protein
METFLQPLAVLVVVVAAAAAGTVLSLTAMPLTPLWLRGVMAALETQDQIIQTQDSVTTAAEAAAVAMA